jgi:hypothetical protein
MLSQIRLYGDSRGCGLTDTLTAATPRSVRIVEKATPGATLQEILAQFKRDLRRYRGEKILAIIVAGICNLTTRTGKKGSRTLQVSYDQSQDNIAEIKGAYNEFTRFSKQAGIDLVLTTIVPASIEKANQHYIKKRYLLKQNLAYSPDQVRTQQKQLEKDIILLNEHVASTTKGNGFNHINLSASVTRSSKKGAGGNRKKKKKVSRFYYTDLFDGVHPNKTLRDRWIDKVRNLCAKKARGEPFDPPTTATEQEQVTEAVVEAVNTEDLLSDHEDHSLNSTEESQSDQEGWSFKR